MNDKKEIARLEGVATESIYADGANGVMIRYTFEILRRFFDGGSILELGPAEGLLSEKLCELSSNVTLVDGSEHFCKMLRNDLPQAHIECCLFEDYEPAEKFDMIVMGHVLEHVIDPVSIIELAAKWLAPGGCIFAAVPNSRSIHRQAAVTMGLLEQEDSMSELDIRHGHRRVFNPETFRACFTMAGMTIDSFGGYWLKPVSNSQIEETWTSDMLNAFLHLGERYPDIAAENYVVARKKH